MLFLCKVGDVYQFGYLQISIIDWLVITCKQKLTLNVKTFKGYNISQCSRTPVHGLYAEFFFSILYTQEKACLLAKKNNNPHKSPVITLCQNICKHLQDITNLIWEKRICHNVSHSWRLKLSLYFFLLNLLVEH